jgi:hypothetical protein
LYWVSRGLTNAEIAERLFISPNVVAEHLTNIYAEFGLFIESDKPIKRYDILRCFGASSTTILILCGRCDKSAAGLHLFRPTKP